MNEFALIDRIRARAARGSATPLGIGDDAAVLEPSPGMQLVATTDNLVAGQHFDDAATPAEIGHLALAVNLSDLAAMGANARWCLLTLTLPEADARWLDAFLDGFLGLAADCECALVGGNLTRGSLNVAVTALGEVDAGRYRTRRGARPGDRLVVTGTLGEAGYAWMRGAPPGHPFRQRLLRPAPRIAAGAELAPIAHAMIDISDGLLADLRHLTGTTLGAAIDAPRLPASGALVERVPDPDERCRYQFAGGDYELLAALPDDATPPKHVGGVALTEIGRVTERDGIRCLDARGRELATGQSGWDPFAAPPPGNGGDGDPGTDRTGDPETRR